MTPPVFTSSWLTLEMVFKFLKKTQRKLQRTIDRVTILGITDHKIHVSELILVSFTNGDPHKVFSYNWRNFRRGFPRSLWVYNMKSKELVINFKKIPLHKVVEDTKTQTWKPRTNCLTSYCPTYFSWILYQKIFKLKFSFSKVHAVLHTLDKDKVRLLKALVHNNAL